MDNATPVDHLIHAGGKPVTFGIWIIVLITGFGPILGWLPDAAHLLMVPLLAVIWMRLLHLTIIDMVMRAVGTFARYGNR